MKMYRNYNGPSKKPQYIIFGLIVLTFVIAYNYLGLSHANSLIKSVYENKIKELEGQLQATFYEANAIIKENPDLKVLNARLEGNVKEIESLQQRLVGHFFLI